MARCSQIVVGIHWRYMGRGGGYNEKLGLHRVFFSLDKVNLMYMF